MIVVLYISKQLSSLFQVFFFSLFLINLTELSMVPACPNLICFIILYNFCF